MAEKDWDETIYDGDCIPSAEWNDMVSYIKHNASCNFIIYDDEESTNQKFKFSYSDDVSLIEGANLSTYDLRLKANSVDSYPFIDILGNSDIKLVSNADIYFFEQTVQMMKFSLVSNDAILEGLSATGKNFRLKANVTDTYPYLYMVGNAELHLGVAAEDEIRMYAASVNMFTFDYIADIQSIIETPSNIDLVLKTQGTGKTDFIQRQSKNFVIENRTSDPDAPAIGQIWYRTDL